MAVFFWDFCTESNCVREWIFFTADLLVFCFTAFSVFNTYRMYGKMRFQLLPLSINCLATLVMSMLQLFAKSFEFYLATFLIEIYTYFLFCYTFMLVYARAKEIANLDTIKKIANIAFVVFTLLILGLTIAVFASALSATCQEVYVIAFYAFFSVEVVLYGLTMYYGTLILKQLLQNQQSLRVSLKPSESFSDSSLHSDSYFKDRKRQIIMILFSYTLTILLRVVWLVLNNVFSDDNISCSLIDQATVIQSDTVLGNFILGINSLIELLPHVLLPIALYVIPGPRIRIRSKSVDLQEGQYAEMEEDEIEIKDDGMILRKKLSQLIDSNLTAGG